MNKEGVEINKSRVFSLARDQERNNDDYSILGPFQLLGLINSNKRPFNSPIVMVTNYRSRLNPIGETPGRSVSPDYFRIPERDLASAI